MRTPRPRSLGWFLVASLLAAYYYWAVAIPGPALEVHETNGRIVAVGTIGIASWIPVLKAAWQVPVSDSNPRLQVDWNSNGGNFLSGWLIAKGLSRVAGEVTATVSANERCESTCVFVVANASRRLTDERAEFTFHRERQNGTEYTSDRPAPPSGWDLMDFAHYESNGYLAAIRLRSPKLAQYLIENGFWDGKDCVFSGLDLADGFPDFIQLSHLPQQDHMSPKGAWESDRERRMHASGKCLFTDEISRLSGQGAPAVTETH